MTMDANLPEPLVSDEVDLRGFSGFMLNVDRLMASELVALGTPEECWAALMLWCRAWKQTPPGSLPDDDRVLRAFSGAGSRWNKVKGMALRGFVKCSDGRLYHKVLCEEANEAWDRRKKFKERSAKANERRWAGNNHGNESAGSQAEQKDGESIPSSTPSTIQEGIQQGVLEGIQQGVLVVSAKDSLDHPVEVTGTGTELLKPPLSESPAEPSITDCPQRELLALYAKHLHMLRQPRVWDGQRADLMRTRWRYCAKANGVSSGYASREEGLKFWDQFFAYVASCKKLTEGIPYKDGTGTIWKPDLPWLLKAENFAKVVEGAYA